MRLEQAVEVVNALPNIKLEEMEIQDQVTYMQAVEMFAKSVQHLVVKYSGRLPENSTFLFKM